jgi:hypothetical protein
MPHRRPNDLGTTGALIPSSRATWLLVTTGSVASRTASRLCSSENFLLLAMTRLRPLCCLFWMCPRDQGITPKRLRAALLERYVAQGQPSPESRVFPSFNGDNFRRRQWADICGKKGAGIGHRQIKDLRDSYASLLLSAGIPLAFVSKQLGHQSMQLTERHYAHYMPDGDEYQAPESLARGEVPADLLARLTERAKHPKTSQLPKAQPTGTERSQEYAGIPLS